MNGAPVIRLRPRGRYNDQDLERMADELAEVVKQQEILHPKQAAAFLGIGITSLYKVKFPYHNLPGLKGRIYLRSELIEFIKKH